MSTEKDKGSQPKIADLPEPATSAREADKVKGGRMATEAGDVTQNGTTGGDTG